MTIQIETDLKDILNRIDLKLDHLQSDVSQINVKLENLSTRMTQVEKTSDKLSTTQDTILKDVSDLKGAKSLVIPILVAVTTSILTLLIKAIPIS